MFDKNVLEHIHFLFAYFTEEGIEVGVFLWLNCANNNKKSTENTKFLFASV